MIITRRSFDITKNYALAIGVFGILCFFGPVAAEQIPVDTVRITSHEAILKDCCGDQIPAEQAAKNKRPERPYPPQASECCAYENVGDDLVVMYSAQPVLSAEYKSYLVVEENGVIVYEQPVASGVGSNGQFREGRWPLTDTAGAPLNVGKDGKRYNIRIEIRNGSRVVDKSGYLPVLVDDCVKRQNLIVLLKTNPNVFNNEAFHAYLDLEGSVAGAICEQIKLGLVERVSQNMTFEDKCHVMCINNYFANKLLELSISPPNSNGNVYARAHSKTQRFIWGGFPNFYPVRSINMQNYASAENVLRAEGYFICGGGLSDTDAQKARDIIVNSIQQLQGVLAGYGADYLVIDRMFDETNSIYNDLRAGNRKVGDAD